MTVLAPGNLLALTTGLSMPGGLATRFRAATGSARTLGIDPAPAA